MAPPHHDSELPNTPPPSSPMDIQDDGDIDAKPGCTFETPECKDGRVIGIGISTPATHGSGTPEIEDDLHSATSYDVKYKEQNEIEEETGVSALHRGDSDDEEDEVQDEEGEEDEDGNTSARSSHSSTPSRTENTSDDEEDTDSAIHLDLENALRTGLEYSDDEDNTSHPTHIPVTMPVPPTSPTATATATAPVKAMTAAEPLWINPLYDPTATSAFRPFARPTMSATHTTPASSNPPPSSSPQSSLIPPPAPSSSAPQVVLGNYAAPHSPPPESYKYVTYKCGRGERLQNPDRTPIVGDDGRYVWCGALNVLRVGRERDQWGYTVGNHPDPLMCRECGSRMLFKVRTKKMVQFEAR